MAWEWLVDRDGCDSRKTVKVVVVVVRLIVMVAVVVARLGVVVVEWLVDCYNCVGWGP